MTKIGKETTEMNLVSKVSDRIHYMDNLRAYAMLFGIVFHAALAYSPLSHNIWLSADTQQSAIMDLFAWFVHLFRMPLFFLIAGYFSILLIERRGVRKMIGNRVRRILLPFVLFLPILMIATFMLIGNSTEIVENPGPMLQAIVQVMSDPEAVQGPMRTMHLWFLYVLMYMYVVAVLISRTNLIDSIKKWLNKYQLTFLVIAPLLVALSLINIARPHPSPDTFKPELWSLGFYGFFFLLGCCLYRNDAFIEKIERYWKLLMIIGTLAYIGFYFLLPEPLSLDETLSGNQHILLSFEQIVSSLLGGVAAVYLTLAFLCIGKKYLNRMSRISRYITDSSYWIYLIHLPLLLFIQFMLIGTELNIWIKLTLSSSSTFIIGILSYVLIVRWTPLGWLLNGRRKSIFK